jgi:hypothetical protein
MRRTDPKGRLRKRIHLSILFSEAWDLLSLSGSPSEWSKNAFRRFLDLVLCGKINRGSWILALFAFEEKVGNRISMFAETLK